MSSSFRFENAQTRRYYLAWAQVDLFGGAIIVRAWGGISSARGSMQSTPMESIDACQRELARIRRQRELRGYRLATNGEASRPGVLQAGEH
jgi:predicted DNA-binding WGR domain protein